MIPVKRGTIFEAFGTSPPSKKKALTRTRSALNFNDFVASDYVKAVRAKFTAARKANGKTDAALASERAKLAKPFTYTYPKKKDTDTEFALSSWNVNSFRAAVRADFFKIFDSWTIAPDALFLQEIKATSKDLDDITSQLQTRGYDIYINSGQRAGYAGTALITKKDHKPLRIVNDYSIMVDVLLEAANGIDSTNTDKYTPDDVLTNVDVQAWDIAMEEGRIITAEYDTFYTVGIYTPNAGQKLERLKFRELVWEPMIQRYLHVLQNKKPVIYCGDLNSARTEYDIFSPDTNHFNAGFTKEERDALNALIGEKTTYLLKFNTEADTTDENKESMEKIVKSPVSANGTTSLDLSTLGCDTTPLFDAFTHMYGENLLHPYTFWGYRSGGRTQNKGWRLDYFIISKKLQNSIRGVLHDKEYVDDKNSRSSDHAPIHLLFQADKV